MQHFEIPIHFRHVRATPFWNKETVLQDLLNQRNDTQDRYVRLSVMQGAIKCYDFITEHDAMPGDEAEIKAGRFITLPPQHWYNIEMLSDDTYFNLDYYAV
ncbi:DUF1971 domain-containing protein [Enterobacteriaceae bacterium H11S18]|uniref:DUF1971 domain-containing protein n=1 Tax=Dryocola clanedunensis TaxID=2925396 RepID=UPI0022F09B2F|nr:DUF1971 domain-containing protein [Dryocola clanedunensis]MCT4709227.1 DUF1971 domain-containing protein [Dryocola clanedunensis]